MSCVCSAICSLVDQSKREIGPLTIIIKFLLMLRYSAKNDYVCIIQRLDINLTLKVVFNVMKV